jgi:hypothetical protein
MTSFRARSVGTASIGPENRLVLERVERRGEDFSRRRLVQLVVSGSTLIGCRFDGLRVDSAAFGAGREQSRYVDCVFDGARLKFAAGGYARFERCSFRDADLRDWFALAVELVDCTFTGRLRKCVFNGTVPDDDRPIVRRDRNEFTGNDFSQADLIDVSFRTGIDLMQQRLPTDDRYVFVADASEAVQRVRAAIAGWQDLPRRQAAITLVRAWESAVAGGQRQLLLRADTYSTLPKDVVAELLGLLTQRS